LPEGSCARFDPGRKEGEAMKVRVKENVYLVEVKPEDPNPVLVTEGELDRYVSLYCERGTIGEYDEDEGCLYAEDGNEYYIPKEFVDFEGEEDS